LIAFIFPGQGSQQVGMGPTLIRGVVHIEHRLNRWAVHFLHDGNGIGERVHDVRFGGWNCLDQKRHTICLG